jgi:hypothetical protein
MIKFGTLSVKKIDLCPNPSTGIATTDISFGNRVMQTKL